MNLHTNLSIDLNFVPKRVLVIVAHPDDIEFGVAGTLAQWTQQGAEIAYVMITDGAAGSNDPDMNPYRLAELRQAEQRAAAAAVGVHDVRFLSYRDGMLEATMDLRRQITRIVRQFKPERVIAQDPSTWLVGDIYINHPDHRAAGEAAIYGVFPASETRLAFPELLDEGLLPHRVRDVWLTLSNEPNVWVDITDSMPHKVEALLCHKTQLDETAIDWIKQRNEDAGKEHGFTYAETFRVMNINPPKGEGEPQWALRSAVDDTAAAG